MSQTSEEYWLQRKLADMARIYNFTEQRIRMLKRDYKLATKELQKLLRDGDVKDYEKKRFKQLLANIDSRLQILFELEAAYAERALSYAYEEEYYRGIFNIQQAVGYGAGTYYIAPDIVETAICTAWSGRSYSDRIWKRKKELGKTVEEILRKGMLMGHSNAKMSKKLAERMDVSLRQAARLIRTETCYVSNQATLQSYKELGVGEYEFLATLDLLTSQTCRHLDGKKYPRDKAQVGLNYPPMHPHCRSTTIPVMDDFGIEGTRLARDADGKNYEVPKSMKYEDWYNQHVKTDPKYVLAEKKIKNKYRDQKQYEKYKEVLGKHAPKTFEEFQEMKYNDVEKWNELKNKVLQRITLQEQLPYIINGRNEFIPKGSSFKTRKAIAGKGASTEIRIVDKLVSEYGGHKGEWSKMVGSIKSAKYLFDVHWYELDGKQYDMKLKYRKEMKRNES